MTRIHPSAIVDPGAELDDDVDIGPCAVVEAHTRIGAGCVIGPGAVLHAHTRLGPGCRVHAHAVLGDVPQDLGYKDVPSYVEIGAHCTIREGVTIHRGTKPDTATRVGNDCYLMANSHLAHNVVLGDGVILANNVLLAGYVEVGAKCFFGGSAAVHQFVHIGTLAMVGGLCALNKDFPPYCISRSGSLNEVTGLNVIGLRRSGMAPEDRAQIKAAFNLLYRSGRNTGQAADELRSQFPGGPAAAFAAFIEASTRGLCGLAEA